jgi:putative ABC transport system permease protein
MTPYVTKSFRVAGLLAFTSIRRGNAGIIILTVLILTLISLNMLFVPGLLNGLVSGANDQLRNTYSGDIVVESDTASLLLSDVDDIIGKIEAIDGVVSATSRNNMVAQLVFENTFASAVVYGVQPDKEKEVFTIQDSLVEGSYLSPDDRDMIMLGMQVAGADKTDLELYARSLQIVHAGDEITVAYGNGVKRNYTVKGIFHTEFIQTDLQAHVSQTEFDSVNPLTVGGAVSIHIRLKPEADIASIIAHINSIESGLKILEWEDYAGIVRSLTDSFNVINVILNVVNFLIAGITVFIVTYIDVANRRRQIGVQRAIGITPASITLSYLMRALFYAVVAIVLAVLLFVFVVTPLEAEYPFHFPFGVVYLVIGLQDTLRMTLIVLGVSLLASFLPVRGVMRMKIMDAIWG